MKGSINRTAAAEKISFAEQAGYRLAFAVIGFFLGGANIHSRIYPFGGAIIAAAPEKCMLAVSAGVLARCIVLSDYTVGAKYMAVAAIIAMVRYMLPKDVRRRKNHGMIQAFVSGGAYLAVNVVNLIIDLASWQAVLIAVAEVALSFGSAYFLQRALKIFTATRSSDKLSGQDCTALLIGFAIVLLSLSPYEIAGMSPARIGAIAVILMFARYGRFSYCVTLGIVSGFALSLGTSGLSYLCGGYAIGGVIAAAFAPLGNFAAAASFFAADLTVALTDNISVGVAASVYECLIAAALFLAIPSSAGHAFVDFFEPKKLIRTDSFKQGALMRLDFASAALREVSDTVESVAAKLRRMNTVKTDLIKGACDSVCSNCKEKEICFGEHKKKRELDFHMIESALREYGTMEAAQLPSSFADECIKKDEFLNAAAREYSDRLLKKSADARIDEFRSIVVGQFKNLSSMLFEMSSLISESYRADLAAEQKIYTVLKDMRLVPLAVSTDVGKFDKMAVSLRIHDNGRDIAGLGLEEKISEVCGRKMGSMSINSAGEDFLINMCEETEYSCKFAASHYNCDENELCGDSYRFFLDGRGNAVIILCDGMGSGGRAAVDGAMASGLMAQLIKAGLGFESALSIVNSSMLYKSEDESLSTVDICSVDLYSGQCDFYKAGAARSLIVNRGRVSEINNNSLPIGILKEISFEKQSEKLDDGALLLMMSDGAADVMGDWIEEEIRNFDGEDIGALSELIAAKAKVLRKMYKDDDITVLAARLDKRAQTS